MGYRCHPSALRMCSFQGLWPNHLACGLHLSSVDAAVDIHNPSHNFPFLHPREAFQVGHWVTTLPLWHPPVITSYGGSLAWGRAGAPVPCMMVAHTQGNANLLM